MDPSYPPKKKKSRRLAKEHVETIKQEVKRLKEVGAIREFLFFGMAGKYSGREERKR